MDRPRDPVERAAPEGTDLYDVATWEPRTLLDRFVAAAYPVLIVAGRVLLVVLAAVILLAQFVLGGLVPAATQPAVLVMVPLSVVPALALAAYVWRADVTEREPLGVLAVTFLLGVLFATFAAVANTLFQVAFGVVGLMALLGPLGMPAFFFLVVGPVEEAVKLLAVRLYAYRSDSFDAVLDGAVYGAVAGLGFATIENYLYISRGLASAEASATVIGAVTSIGAVRALAGPGHVIYSAIAGYYLGLAKFNPDDAGPIVLKGLLVAAVVHAAYNSLVGVVPGLLGGFVPPLVAFLLFVLVYDGILGYYLYRKLDGYATAYRATHEDDDSAPDEG